MRVYQNIFAYASYLNRLGLSIPRAAKGSFETWQSALRDDRYCAVHHLEPGPAGDVFLTCVVNDPMQRAWAKAQRMPANSTAHDIVLAQVEAHRSEVFYTQDPGRYGPAFLRRLPGSVRHRICWQSPPANAGDLTGYDTVVNNFPTSLADYASQGVRTAYFTPSFDTEMARFSENSERPIDIAFVGGYSQYHRKRAAILEQVAQLDDRLRVVFALDRSRLTRLAESPLGYLLPVSQHRRPAPIRRATIAPVFGLEMYRLFSQSKIVLNGAVDSAGEDRGNMRCFEALGCGALMLTDAGSYPRGMVDGETMMTYRDGEDIASTVLALLADPKRIQGIAGKGYRMLRDQYSKPAQWNHFQAIIGGGAQ